MIRKKYKGSRERKNGSDNESDEGADGKGRDGVEGVDEKGDRRVGEGGECDERPIKGAKAEKSGESPPQKESRRRHRSINHRSSGSDR
jgi:hypothetical protein